MTPSEFKAWFEGFTESMDGPPSLKQWERIQARVKQITGAPTSYPVFVDRYLPAYPHLRPYWGTPVVPYGITGFTGQSTGAVNLATLASNQGGGGTVLHAGTCDGKVGHVAFDSHVAMNALGRADAESIAT